MERFLACAGREVQPHLHVLLRRRSDEVHTAVEVRVINAAVKRIEHELLAMHGGGAPVRGVHRGADPFEVAPRVAVDLRMDVRRLRNEIGTPLRMRDRLREIIRGRLP